MLINVRFKTTFIFIIACFSLTVAAIAATVATFTGQINANNINVRGDATTSSAIVCTLSKGKLVEVVAQAYDWYKIRLPKEAPSYVKRNLVECINMDPVTNPGKCLGAKVIKDRINVRLSPSDASLILGKIDKLTVVSILSRQGDWYRIAPVHTSFGWVNKKFINVAPIKNAEPAVTAKEVKPSGQLVIEGQVSPYGIVLWRTATHKLITPANKIYLLKGNRKSLDSLNYHKVKVTGKLLTPGENKYPIIAVDIIEVLS